MNILVLEASTNSAKAAVFSQSLTLLSSSSSNYTGGIKAISKRSIEDVWNTLLKVCREAVKEYEINVIAINGIWMSLLLCDNDMNPLSPVYTWADTRSQNITKELKNEPEYVDRYRSITGCNVHAIFPYFKVIYEKNERKNLNGIRICSEASYIFAKMTGKWFSSKCLESASGIMNIKTLEWEQELIDELGINQEQLPMLMPYDMVFPLKEEIARQLNLKSGTPVCLPHSDGAMNQLGEGGLQKGIMTMSIGTSGALRVAVDAPFMNLDLGTWLFYSPTSWLLGSSTSGAANCVNWFRTHVIQGSTSWERLNSLAQKAKEDTPVFLPFIYGERCPGWQDDRLGGFARIKPEHGLPELYAALLEGVAFNMYQCYQQIVTICGEPDTIRLSGGVLGSTQWLKIIDGLWQRNIVISSIDQVSLLGGAVLALKACGVIADLKEFRPHKGEVLDFSKEEAEIYRCKYNRYLDFYSKI